MKDLFENAKLLDAEYRLRAKRAWRENRWEIPEDVAAWLEHWQEAAEEIPHDMRHRAMMDAQLRTARDCHRRGDTEGLMLAFWLVSENCENAKHDLWVGSIEAPRSKGGAATAEERKKERAGRVARAKQLWVAMAHIPERNRASTIARRMGLSPAKVREYLRGE